MKDIIFFDTEVSMHLNKIVDIGAVNNNGSIFHACNKQSFLSFIDDVQYLCGHNIISHDLQYIYDIINGKNIKYFIDTLYFSPLLFPKAPYHALVKDDKLDTDELNNPLNDAKKAKDLFYDEINSFAQLNENLKIIYFSLLKDKAGYGDFFKFINFDKESLDLDKDIKDYLKNKICQNADVLSMAKKYPIELAYAISQITVIDKNSLTPPWVLIKHPRVENIIKFLRNKDCGKCQYCNDKLDEIKALKRFYKYDSFRTFDGKSLQQDAVKCAIKNQSLLAIFPTGGGKSITFQLPALMDFENEKGLTVVISPLQSLMKDQVDNLEKNNNITFAVTINGSLDPIERKIAFDRVKNGSVGLLYISPESLRNKSIQALLLSRNVVRFVIDEAHCFSVWGQDFRSDYLYIADFIKIIQNSKSMPINIPVSCFTATAKEKVIEDIISYFNTNLNLDLQLLRASATRKNLSYHVIEIEREEDKFIALKKIIGDDNSPIIIYTSRTKKASELAKELKGCGYEALFYHGQMDRKDRIASQEQFMSGEKNIIVATTAFGMGVDKKDVKKVIHYDISDSLENYVQEAGRAGRDENLHSDCYILFSDESLNKHFILLNQTKISQKEIRQVWKTIKTMTKSRQSTVQSALEVARESGWNDSVSDVDTRVKTAINALEQSAFIKRGQNMPKVYADSIIVKNMAEVRQIIDNSPLFNDEAREKAIRVIGSLISKQSTTKGKGKEAETRVDYISDNLGIVKIDVIKVINLLREAGVLADSKDLLAFMGEGENQRKAQNLLEIYIKIEKFLCKNLSNEEAIYNLKELNSKLNLEVENSDIQKLKTLLNYYDIKHIIKRQYIEGKNLIKIYPRFDLKEIAEKANKRHSIAKYIITYLYNSQKQMNLLNKEKQTIIKFSMLELKNDFNHNLLNEKVTSNEIEDAIYYLMKIGSMKLEGGFLVVYLPMTIKRLADNKLNYTKEHYKKLDDYYESKKQQIHIVGEYARKMLLGNEEALNYVEDYFNMNYDFFIAKYFKNRKEELSLNMTKSKFNKLFSDLSKPQLKIINDNKSKYIVVGAGPGSGKTKVLTHKLASLYMTEDVKHEQMLMLTFSRASATEFKKRLKELIGNASHFIQITTFHSYCFDVLGNVGSVDKSDQILSDTINKINNGQVDFSKITKTVLVIDEAQDMSLTEFQFVKVLMEKNQDMRIIAVGDDDQNIYEFRNSNSKYFISLLNEENSAKYELVDNYRSKSNLVAFANMWAKNIKERFKITDVIAFNKSNGIITLNKITNKNIIVPIMNSLVDIPPKGSTCIVLKTNMEALTMQCLLEEHNIKSTVIQSASDSNFNLYDMIEFREFIQIIEKNLITYTISIENWFNAKSQIKLKFNNSLNIIGVLKILNDFELFNVKTKYLSDLKQYIRESKLEDFIENNSGKVFISTIHQTKGREFENVYLGLTKEDNLTEEKKRAIYVAITRAKSNLHIFTNSSYFDGFKVQNFYKHLINDINDLPKSIAHELNHKDVFLDMFKYYQNRINKIISGDILCVNENGCTHNGKDVVIFSNKYKAQIENLKQKGYIIKKAIVRHILFWRGLNNETEIKIVLPKIIYEYINQ